MRSVVVICVLAIATPVVAAPLDVTFTGVVADTCTLAVPTPGVMMLSADGKTLGTDETLGVPATVTVVSLGDNTISLSAPALVSSPVGYGGGETVTMAYSGLASQAFTGLPQTIDIGILSITNLIVDMRVNNNSGFTQGIYVAKTVLTCS